MIIYNITTKVHYSIDKEWLRWQQASFIPAMMATGLFLSNHLFRLLEQDDSEGNTYAVQYTIAGQQEYDQYLQNDAPLLRQLAATQWGELIISFHSALEVIQ